MHLTGNHSNIYRMKSLIYTILLTLAALPIAMAQRTIDAGEIVDRINRNQAISYEDVTVQGDLDLTELSNKKRRNEDRWGGEAYLSTVQAPISFRNCTFTGKFLAYKNLRQDGRFWEEGVVYTANFDEAVTFENCTFKADAAFKYSTFRQRALFAGSTFGKEAQFKYARFEQASDFSGCLFKEFTHFKYTQFNEATTFRQATFAGTADFKYTKFDEGVSFSNAVFEQLADFKYTHLPRGSNFEAAQFDGVADFKYTTLDGRRFSPVSRSR
ncbi:hypothetical protein GCM10023187_35520 [Nibrella viscosa]|uniref:Pentapeptide repeat-containing protein n=2 Tax=Nibrella viscosa TaxID=1084524 RepID=A0ABP8KN05_9BACT